MKSRNLLKKFAYYYELDVSNFREFSFQFYHQNLSIFNSNSSSFEYEKNIFASNQSEFNIFINII